MIPALNADLLVLGVVISAIGILGFVVLFQDSKSDTARAFFLFSLVSVAWGIFNYASYQTSDPTITLWLTRFVIFAAVWFCFGIFHLAYIFPQGKVSLPRWYVYALVPLVAASSLLTLTPYIFAGLAETRIQGIVPKLIPGPAIPVFGVTVFLLVVGAVYIFIRKIRKGDINQGLQVRFIMVGTATTFALLILCNFILPIGYGNYIFIPFAGIFTFPFIACTAYAIMRYHLFNVRVVATEIFAFALTIATLLQVMFSKSTPELIFRMASFVLVLAIVILLIRSVLREVEQREKIEKLAKELAAANDRLKELDQLKNEFLSVASHQLRAPITAIRGYVANMADGSYGEVPDYLKEPLGVVQESARVMVSSIEDYLNVSRIEQGRMKYEMAPVEVTAVAKRATEELVPLAKAKGLELTFSESPLVTVTADFGKIKQVFTNLIDNAIKYTEKGSVTISITKDEKVVRFMTSDTGIGIAADEIDKLFEKFTRARDANQVNTTGTGLGLYVAKNLVEGQGGTIHVESDGVGKGSRFIVELPLEQARKQDA